MTDRFDDVTWGIANLLGDDGYEAITDDSVWDFVEWWDRLTDARAAVDAVWPQETGAT